MMREYIDIVSHARVFNGLSSCEICSLLDQMGAFVKPYYAGASIPLSEDAVNCVALLVQGEVKIVVNPGPHERTMFDVCAGQVIADESVIRTLNTAIDARVTADAVVMFVPMDTFTCVNPDGTASGESVSRFTRNVTHELSEMVVRLVDTLALLSIPRLEERVLLYLSELPQDSEGYVTVPFSRSEWAKYLSVANKTLIRVLSSLREQGVLLIDDRHIKVISNPYVNK